MVDARFHHRDAGAYEHAVELADRLPGVKTGPKRDRSMMQAEIADTAAAPPFVEIARQQGRQRIRLMSQLGQDRARLLAAPQPREIEMHADQPKRVASGLHVRQDRAARFERGEVDRLVAQYLDIGADQHGITMPAHTAGPHLVRHRTVPTMICKHVERNRAVTITESTVGFLEQDDVRADFTEDVENALGAPATIGGDCLANIITSDEHHGERTVRYLCHSRND